MKNIYTKSIISLGVLITFLLSSTIFPVVYWHSLAKKAEASILEDLTNIIKKNWWAGIIVGAIAALVIACTEVDTPVGGVKPGICNALDQAIDKAWSTLKDFFNEFLKKKLLDYLVDNIIRWIQGEDEKPLFVTNFEDFLNKVVNDAVGEYIEESSYSFLCRPFGKDVLLRIFRPTTLPPTCTLDEIVANIENFYENFTQGGWPAFEEILYPWNNPIGAYLISLDNIDLKVASKTGVKEMELSQTTGGLLHVTRCVQCTAERTDTPENVTVLGLKPSHCKEMKNDPKLANFKCQKEEIITPGTVIGESLTKAIGSSLDFIVNSADLTIYIAAIADAAINRLIRESITRGGLLTMSTPSASSTPGGPPPPGYFDYSKQRYSCIDGICAPSNDGQFDNLENCLKNCKYSIRYNCDEDYGICYESSFGTYNTLNECQANCGKSECEPSTCDACNGGYYVRGRGCDEASGICDICTGVKPVDACSVFCLHTKDFLWDGANLPDPFTFNKEQLTQYSQIFTYFGFDIPEQCTCTKEMFSSAGSFGGCYGSGVCKECIYSGLEAPDNKGNIHRYFICKKAEWCEQNCQ